MRITAPYVGHIWMILRTLGVMTGLEVVPPPPPTRRTVSLGVANSPEWMCFPFKVVLGNFYEAIELGADTVLMADGPQLCRLGYYSRLFEQILHETGHPEVRVLSLNWQDEQVVALGKFLRVLLGDQVSWRTVAGLIRHALGAFSLIEEVEQRVHYLRPRAQDYRAVENIWKGAEGRVGAALNGRQLKEARRELFTDLDALPLRPEAEPLRVGILGEFIMAMDPFYNFDLEAELGRRGVEVKRFSWVTSWAKVWLFLAAVGQSHDKAVRRAAAPYLTRDVSGEGMQTIGETVLMAQDGFDGIVHLQPFTCLPEIVAQNILPNVMRDHDIPVLEMIVDEQTGKMGLLTRLEAFVDLMSRRRSVRRAAAGGDA